MSGKEIRPISIGLIGRDAEILVAEAENPSHERAGYRPLGGAIEYGESSREALEREFREELDAVLVNVRFLDVVENIFTFGEEIGHEIVFVYRAEFEDEEFYREEPITAKENGVEFPATWKPLMLFESGEVHLYPPEILNLVRRAEI